ncbi:glyoxal oxidase-related protein [Perilla frutescens var. hirtella]|uniref:Aldehyde oxidase GLOX n=1 Tax=Perilla frutescens var. hirtella TaxID=608512 RepID=A0AAD4P299_PERFH|nr:glyoxal oxidase-related protein [Perilla frutescens var. hirtella]
MHMQLLHTDRVVIFDRTDFGNSNISLPGGKCRHDPFDTANKDDCTAHSVEYDVASGSVRPLMVLTDTWCSSGAVLPDGTLVQTGGYNDGDHAARIYKPCSDGSCDWQEINPSLAQRRWYATNHILPDGRVIIIGGTGQFNYEFYPKKTAAETAINLPFLAQTNDQNIENNLYPYVFLNVDGNLFIFANNRAILFDYVNAVVVKNYPAIPGGDPRNYPSTGSAVLLPLKNSSGAEVLVCGGAPKGSYVSTKNGKFVEALDTCGRIRIQDQDPQWVMETMPVPRVFGDMILLPNGEVLLINGAGSGVAGWDLGKDPVLSPVIYRPDNPIGSRFEVQSSSSTPRMYHSAAILLRDGRVLVGGSNPHEYYNFTGVDFPTDLTLEAFSPSYLNSTCTSMRPQITSPVSQSKIGYTQQLEVGFTVPSGQVDGDSVTVTMVAPSFTTHSFAMNQRLLVLDGGNLTKVGSNSYQIQVVTPGSGQVAPSGYYLLFVVHQNIPSEGIWVQLN